MNSSEKIRVVFTINDFIIGGVQRLYLEMFTHLDPARYDMHLITLSDLPGKIDMYSDIPAHVTQHRLAFKGFKDVRNLLALRRLLGELSPDVILTSLFFSNTLVRLAVVDRKIPVIAIEQNTNTWKTPAQIMVDRLFALRTKVFVASSATVKAFASRQMNISPDRFEIIHNSIDLDRIQREQKAFIKQAEYRSEFEIQPNERIVVNVARLTQQKNQLMLIEAFVQFSAAHPGWRLLIVGEGPDRGKLEDAIEHMGTKNIVTLVGARSDVFAFYFISDFFVATSFIEGFGIAHAEALATGLPVLTTRTAGPDEMITEGENGRFVEMTVSSITEGLSKMAEEGVRANTEEIRQSVARFDSHAIAGRYDELIRRVVSR